MSELPHDHGSYLNINQIRNVTEKKEFDSMAKLVSQLGDPTRMKIFWVLCHCECCVVNLSSVMNMSSPAVSHHLRLLRDSGLITSTRVGKEVYYTAADTVESRYLHRMIEDLMEIACIDQKQD